MKKSKIALLVTVIVLAAAMVFSGCKVNKKTPEEVLTQAMDNTVKSVENVMSISENAELLRSGLLSVEFDLKFREQPVSFRIMGKDKKVIVASDMLNKALGIDLSKITEKFSGSVFGVDGGNVFNLTREAQDSLLEQIGKFVSSEDLSYDVSGSIVDAVKDNSTMSIDRNQSVNIDGKDVKANVLTIDMTAGQLNNIYKKLAGVFASVKDYAGLAFGMIGGGYGGLELPDRLFDGTGVKDGDEVVKVELYTGTKDDELLGGKMKLDFDAGEYGMTVNEEIGFAVKRTDDSIRYDVSMNEGGNSMAVASFAVTNKDGVEVVSLDAGGFSVLKLAVDRNNKSISIGVLGIEILKLGYDVQRDAGGNVSEFALIFNIGDIKGLSSLGLFGLGLPGFDVIYEEYYDDDVIFEDGDDIDGIYDYDFDDDGDYYDDDDDFFGGDGFGRTGSGLFSGTVTLRFSADGALPEYREILDMTEADFSGLFESLFGSLIG